MKKKTFKRKKGIFFVSLFVLSLMIISLTIRLASKEESINNLSLKSVSLKDKKIGKINKANIKNKIDDKIETKNSSKDSKNISKKNTYTDILMSFVGDCTLGTDSKFSGETMPVTLYNNNMDFSYLFKNVSSYLKKDDLTIANLETTFTNATIKNPKTFNFKAPPSYVKSLTLGSIEAVNISNNHIYDYKKKGYNDTKKTLEQEKINYFGEGTIWKTTIKNKKFAFLGYRGWEENINFDKLKSEITQLKSEEYTVIISFHWGVERQYHPIEFQKKLAHFCIDNGADLIIGHHPHVLQGIETYKGKYICYSLANFCFGGNNNPQDKDTMIVQTQFNFKDDKLIKTGLKIIPCSISSVKYKNDYCPTPLKGDNYIRVLNKLNEISPKSGFKLSEDFHFEKHE